MLSTAAIAAISFYQNWISPYKGYRCAYSVLHGGTGCSGYIKSAIQKHGPWRAIPLAKERFAACRTAYENLRAKKRGAKEKRCSKRDACACDPCAPTFEKFCRKSDVSADGCDLPCDCSF